MNKNWILLSLITLIASSANLFAQQVALNEWRVHIPYSNPRFVVDDGEKIFTANNLSMYSFDKEDNSVQRFSKVSGMSDVGADGLAFNRNTGTLIVPYDNSNIDLLTDGRITNYPFIKEASIVGDKSIYHVHFKGDSAYLSCGFGIVVLNTALVESPATYFFNTIAGTQIRVNAVSTFSNSIYAATEEGLYVADLSNPLLEDFSNWALQDFASGLPAGEIKTVVNFNGDMVAQYNDSLYRLGNSWEKFYGDTAWAIKYVRESNGNLVIIEEHDSQSPRITIIAEDGTTTVLIDDVYIIAPMEALVDQNGIVWIADLIRGLLKIEDGVTNAFNPDGPFTSKVFEMASFNDKVWVAPGEVSPNWNVIFNRDGFFRFTGDSWRNYNKFNQPALDSAWDLIAVAIDPRNEDVYFGSFGAGLVHFNGDQSVIYNDQNSTLQGAVGDEGSVRITGLAFDINNNLWIANDNAPEPIAVLRANGEFHSFEVNATSIGPVVIDELGQKWFMLPRDEGLAVYDHGTDIVSTSDDRFKKLGSGEGNGNLHTLKTRSIAVDLDGEIWVGTTEGIIVFYNPYEVFSGTSFGDGSQIIVEQDGFGEPLLKNEVVNSIAIDGGNRKWMGTNNGVFLISEDGTEQLFHFTTENSPLLSNAVLEVAINQESGEVFFGTDKGIISYRGESTGGKPNHENALIFPNPVRADYSGPIAISGLVENAVIKITDVSGILIYETQALGGQAIWDGNNVNGRRAQTGVYLVFSSNEDGSEKFVGKLLVVN